MKFIDSSYEILTDIDSTKILSHIEKCGRVCYKSENKIYDDKEEYNILFIQNLISNEHLSVLEHEKISIKFIVDRGVSHELVRHRIASFSQESTRYCNYSKNKFGSEITFIDISKYMKEEHVQLWKKSLEIAEKTYLWLLKNGSTPEIARSVLPNSLKTEIIVTANLREWRLIMSQRTSNAAHPQMRDLMRTLLKDLQTQLPIIFDDISY